MLIGWRGGPKKARKLRRLWESSRGKGADNYEKERRRREEGGGKEAAGEVRRGSKQPAGDAGGSGTLIASPPQKYYEGGPMTASDVLTTCLTPEFFSNYIIQYYLFNYLILYIKFHSEI